MTPVRICRTYHEAKGTNDEMSRSYRRPIQKLPRGLDAFSPDICFCTFFLQQTITCQEAPPVIRRLQRHELKE